MSAATLVNQVSLPEAIDSCKVLILYDDPETHDRAMGVCRWLVGRFNAEPPLVFDFWDWGKLAAAAGRQPLSGAVADADIILVSVRGRRAAVPVAGFLASCAALRRKAEGALALQLADWPGAPAAAEALFLEFHLVAQQLRMDFLPRVSAPGGDIAGAQEGGGAGWASVGDGDVGAASRGHWGLNE